MDCKRNFKWQPPPLEANMAIPIYSLKSFSDQLCEEKVFDS